MAATVERRRAGHGSTAEMGCRLVESMQWGLDGDFPVLGFTGLMPTVGSIDTGGACGLIWDRRRHKGLPLLLIWSAEAA